MRILKFPFFVFAGIVLVTTAAFYFNAPNKLQENRFSGFSLKKALAQEVKVSEHTQKTYHAEKALAKTASLTKKTSVKLAAANPAPAPVQTAQPAAVNKEVSCAGSFNSQFLCLLNQYRKSLGKSVISFDQSLITVAQYYSNSMNSSGVFAHKAPDGTNFSARCKLFNTSCYGEILAYNFGSPEKLLTAWKNSPGHNAVMLGNYKSFGLGVTGKYATGLFR